jgi:hypothetical protein
MIKWMRNKFDIKLKWQYPLLFFRNKRDGRRKKQNKIDPQHTSIKKQVAPPRWPPSDFSIATKEGGVTTPEEDICNTSSRWLPLHVGACNAYTSLFPLPVDPNPYSCFKF